MKLILFMLVPFVLAGCGGEEFQDLRDFVKNSGADMRGKIDPPPEVKPYESFAYNNDANLPDPFKPRKPDPRSSNVAGANQPDLDRPKEALEEFPLESLKMIGYLFDEKKKVGHAIIRAPDNKQYRVRAGNYLGMNFGLIKSVAETEITLKEMIQDSSGDWSERISTLQLIQ
jgi:type IV pilus assembly protein PilP